VRQVGYLQRLYRNAWSTEHKNLCIIFVKLTWIPLNFRKTLKLWVRLSQQRSTPIHINKSR